MLLYLIFDGKDRLYFKLLAVVSQLGACHRSEQTIFCAQDFDCPAQVNGTVHQFLDSPARHIIEKK